MTKIRAQLTEVYPMLPYEPMSGSGAFLEDAAGRRVLDLSGGHAVAALGYGHPRLTAALARQAERLYFQSNAVNLAVRDAAAERVAAFAPDGLDRVFFVNSGAEANENALRIAAARPHRP
jgi:4-aminobutyrate aminotransferase-like enzyme